MFGASLYIIRCSFRNRLRRSVRRLREPRYLAALLAGAPYSIFSARTQSRFRTRQQERGRDASFADAFPIVAAAGASLVGLGVMLGAALAWVFPGTGTLLEFSKAETQM